MEENKKIENKPVQTYRADMQSAILGISGSDVKKIIDEEERKTLERELSPESKKNRIFIGVSLFLILAAVGLVAFWYSTQKEDVLSVRARFQPLIFHDSTVLLEVGSMTKEKVAEAIWLKGNETTVKEGGIEGLYLTENKKMLGWKRLLALLRANLAGKELDPISENMLLGVFNAEDPSPVVEPVVEEDSESQVIPESAIEVPTIEVEGEAVSLSTGAFFKTGTVEFVDASALEKAKDTISEFLDTVDLKTSKIKVLGTYSVERPWDKNQEIAEARRDLGVAILMEVLTAKYNTEEMQNVIVESEAKGVSILELYPTAILSSMSKDEVDQAINATQGIQYEAVAKTKSTFVPRPLPPKLPEPEEAPELTASDYIPRTERDLFILMKARSFTDVFPSMRVWEHKMFNDLHTVFGIPINSKTSYLLTKSFTDGIVGNKNARILYTNEGEIALMYIFADETSIIITNSTAASSEVMLRLAGSRIRK